MSKVNENIRNFRIFRGLSQKQLGDALQRTPNVISNWETGTHSPDMETIERICNVLHVTPNELYGWDVNQDFEEYKKNFQHLSDRLSEVKKQRVLLEKEYQALNAKLAERELLFTPPPSFYDAPDAVSRPHRSRKPTNTED